MDKAVRPLPLFCLLLGACATPAPGPASALAPGPVSAPAPGPVPTPGPASAPAPAPPTAAAGPLNVCDPAALKRAFGDLAKDYTRPELGPPTLADLEPVPPASGKLGELEHGPAFFGSRDFDADGREDRVLLFTSVDYWLWLVFVERAGCHELVGGVEGYQVETGARDGSGFRVLDAWSYPLQGERVRYRAKNGSYARVGEGRGGGI